MQTLVREAREQIVLGVFKDGKLTPADSTPTFVVIDADTEDQISNGTAIPKLDGNGDPTGNYYLIADPETETALNRVLKVTWSFALDGYDTTHIDYYKVETPYASLDDIYDYHGWSAQPSDLNYMDPHEITKAEKLARTIIIGYTNQDFGLRYGLQEEFGRGSDALELLEVMQSIDKVWENDILVIDNTTDPVYNTFGFSMELTLTNKAVRIYNPGWSVRYDNQVDPAILFYGRFRNNSRYKFEGLIGYKYVPEDIKLASMMLVGDMLTNDYNWRNKYLNKVNLSEVSFSMAGGAFNGTGNIAVDNILDLYRNIRIVVI